MKVKDVVDKFSFLIIEQDGQQALRTFKKVTPQEAAYIKANKQEIIDEILRQKAEREATEAKRKRQREEERQRLIDSGEAKLALVYYGSYLLNAQIAYVVKMNEEEKADMLTGVVIICTKWSGMSMRVPMKEKHPQSRGRSQARIWRK